MKTHGLSPERLRVCAWHEAGHAVAFTAHGITVGRVRVGGGFFRDGDGDTQVNDNTLERRLTVEQNMLCTAAGTAAEMLLYDQLGHTAGRAQRLAATNCGSDMDYLHRFAERTTYTIADAERDARAHLINHWTHLQAVIDDLIRRGRISGRDVARHA